MAEALPPAWSLSTVTLTVLCCYSTVPRGSSSQGEEHVLSSWLLYHTFYNFCLSRSSRISQLLYPPFIRRHLFNVPS